MDALLIETEPYGDREIVDPSNDYWTGEILATLELVRSWDHSARTADELAQSVAAETMFYVLRPVLLAAGCRVDTARWIASRRTASEAMSKPSAGRFAVAGATRLTGK